MQYRLKYLLHITWRFYILYGRIIMIILTKGGSMTELLLRLIKDGKIVGYQEYYYDEGAEEMVIVEYENYPHKPNDMITYISVGETSLLRPTSFDHGIRVGDEWWFDGDYVVGEGVYRNAKSRVKKRASGEFRVTFIKSGIYRWDMVVSEAFREVGWKRIGTIHDKEG